MNVKWYKHFKKKLSQPSKVEDAQALQPRNSTFMYTS